ncbi:MAG TPA: hypothetical protein VLQ48_13725 [Chloroflexia bacterium]|nr:hypothetical protein [Chloroflexia bacterium]
MAGAWVLAVWAYYGLYISPVMTSVSALLAPKTGQEPTVRWPGGLPELAAWTADYVVSLLPIVLAVVGLALLFVRKHRSPGARRALALLVLWALILPVFFLVNYKVDMIGKHLFFTMVPIAVAGGVALFALARRGRWGAALAGLGMALVAWQGIIFWIARLVGQSS